MIQVGSVAVFVLRHKDLVGGGKKDLQHIAQVIAINMVSDSFLVLVSELGDLDSTKLNDAISSKPIQLSYLITVRVSFVIHSV